MNKKIFFIIFVILLITVPVLGSSILDEVSGSFKEFSDKFYNRNLFSEKASDENLITGQDVLTTCTDANILFKVSSSTNAHAALYNYASYNFRACIDGVTIIDRTCNADNSDLIIKLSSDFNAHVEKNTGTNYNVKVCSGDLTCNYKTANCNVDEKCVASISSDTNAHVGECNNYNTKLCCKASGCNINSCEQNICNGQTSCQAGGCSWDSSNNKCCTPGKKWDSLNNKCNYGLITVTLDTGQSTKFIFDNKEFTLKLNSITDSSTSITVSTTTTNLALNNYLDVNLNIDPKMDFRVKLDQIVSTTKATFTYLLSDTGVCTSSTCDTNSFCKIGLDQCTFGTTCNFYPPNSNQAGCCPEGKRWDTTTRLCVDSQGSSTCTNIGGYQNEPLPYEDVCCQASLAYGFWYPAQPYN